MKKPYVRLYKILGKYYIWIMNGKYIRDHIDPNFTNFADHTEKKYIPNREIWLDVDCSEKEYQYYINEILEKIRLLNKGVSRDKALYQAATLGKRQRSVEPSRLIKRRIGKIGDVILYKVLGKSIRNIYPLFTQGGHDLRYKFIPNKTIYIDNSLKKIEESIVIIHEFFERCLMFFRLKYEQAHAYADLLQNICTNRPKLIKSVLYYIGVHQYDYEDLMKLFKILSKER